MPLEIHLTLPDHILVWAEVCAAACLAHAVNIHHLAFVYHCAFHYALFVFFQRVWLPLFRTRA